MGLGEEIAELCQTVLLFQRNISSLKEELFNMPVLTKGLVWNHVVGEKYLKAKEDQLAMFFRKHGLRLSKFETVLLVSTYSSKKDSFLTPNDLWSIFKPLTVKFVDEIMQGRARKQVLAKNHEPHYKISDLLCSIIKKTVQFLVVAEEMKKNVVRADPQELNIYPMDSVHLQIYLHPYAPNLVRKDVDVIFSHIMRDEFICEKTFKEYFMPRMGRIVQVNPNLTHELVDSSEMKGLQLLKYHYQNIGYVASSLKKKPIYLLSP